MIKKFKILSLATTYPESPKSTKPRFVHLLNRELVKFGVDVLTICPHSKGSDFKDMEGVRIKRFRYLPTKYELNNSSIPDEISRSKTGYLKIIIMSIMFFLSSFFQSLREKPDIYHAHWVFPAGFTSYILAKLFNKKNIVTIHGGEILFLKKFKILRKIIIHSLNESFLVVTNSSFTKNEIVQMGVNAEKIKIMKVSPNFLSHKNDKKFSADLRDKIAGKAEFLVLFCGRLVERKGVQYLINAFDFLKDHKICLIVVGGGEMLPDLQKLVEKLKIKDKVIFYGRASDDELSNLRDISDIFVCPSITDKRGITEYLGLVIPEAMESGLPVIASNVGGIIDIIEHEKNGLLVKPQNSKEIADAIDRLIQDESLKNQIVKNSKKTVSEFQPSNIAKDYLEIFKKMI